MVYYHEKTSYLRRYRKHHTHFTTIPWTQNFSRTHLYNRKVALGESVLSLLARKLGSKLTLKESVLF